MKPAVPMQIVRDVIALMERHGIITPDGDFDGAELDTLQENASFAADVAAAMEARGVELPDVVGTIIQTLPLLSLFVKKPKPKPVAG